MTQLKRLLLDILKPHQPNSLVFAQGILQGQSQCRVNLKVIEMDAKTETLSLEVLGSDIDFEQLSEAISSFGGSIHSIDEVDVQTSSDCTQAPQ